MIGGNIPDCWIRIRIRWCREVFQKAECSFWRFGE